MLSAREQEVDSDMVGTHPASAPIPFGWLIRFYTVRAKLAWDSGGFYELFHYNHNIIGICC